MLECAFCDGPVTLENPASATRDPDTKAAVDLLMRNKKIVSTGRDGRVKRFRVDFSLPPGDPDLGGSCPTRTPACNGCYAQLGDIVYGSAAERRAWNMQFFKDDPQAWIAAMVADIQRERPPIVRIHGFGDFFSAEYVAAWTVVVAQLRGVKFFGTTRTWQYALHPGATEQAYAELLTVFRSQRNVFFGASIEGDAYLRSSERLNRRGQPIKGTGRRTSKGPNHRDRVLSARYGRVGLLDWLRNQDPGYNIWNMLSEVADPMVRKELGMRVASGKVFKDAAREQFQVASEVGWMVGIGCKEQFGTKRDCNACRHCLHKPRPDGKWDVSFAFHPGKDKALQIRQWQYRLDNGVAPTSGAEREWRAGRG